MACTVRISTTAQFREKLGTLKHTVLGLNVGNAQGNLADGNAVYMPFLDTEAKTLLFRTNTIIKRNASDNKAYGC